MRNLNLRLESLKRSVLYAITDGLGYIRVDSTAIGKEFLHGFINAVQEGLIGEIVKNIPHSVLGELNEKTEVIQGIYRFSFKISGYERDSEHSFEVVDDPIILPENERIGRVVDLKITVI